MDHYEAYPPASILIVDDNARDITAFESVLEPLGHRIVTAPSGECALELAATSEFATILVDVKMAKIDGFETIAGLRRLDRARATPMILVTAFHDSRELVQRGYAAGAVDYIAKPVDPELLRLKVAAFVLLYQRGLELKRQTLTLALAQARVAQAEEARRRVEEAKAFQDRFIAILGHDLRNPLNVIGMASAKSRGCERCSDAAERIGRASARMESIINAVVDFAHGHFTGEIPISPAAEDLAETCRKVVDDFRSAEAERPVVLQSESFLPGTFDRARIEQVLSNLLANALKHGTGPTTVAVGQHEGTLSLSVHNHGPPIPADQLSTIFGAFRKANTSTGLGLGLFIVHQILRAHGGNVKARSSDAEGTTFLCVWPSLRGGKQPATPSPTSTERNLQHRPQPA